MSDAFPLSPISARQELGKPLPEQIANFIAEKIFRGDYQPGERLKEEELANLFKTSRAPVRESLYLLQIDGLVERLPRRGTVVKEYTNKEIQELYEVRLGLEQLAIDKLAFSWNDDAHQQFLAILSEMKTALKDFDTISYASHNAKFHKLLFKLAGNEILSRLYQQLGNPLTALLHLSVYKQEHMESSYHEHEEIVRALHDKRFQLAKELISQNVNHGMNRAMQLRK
ncbi:GntR family transcriptional regulator [Fodinisporobacter ferrooxydans]|uniref:GntR family transcriptional regulator n=1 Tax=Fodinisporobacter ferrooxydans TaxID=2901836 RepID=A0ABY4CDN3_9BACL|nr:GntR family transcriptional regulator [Alicyclobacillaceae bacterium MYW30-H2]